MWIIIIAVLVLASLHSLLGVMSVCIGVAASIQAEVWMAHSVSPIWSGGFFIITGVLGYACSKWKTAYMILCFTAFSIVSMVTAVVSIQLLRLGLVNHTTDGHTFQKDQMDMLIIVALGVAGTECLVCLVSSLVSCRLARSARKELMKRRDGTFHVQDFSSMNDCSVPQEDGFTNGQEDSYTNPSISIENIDDVGGDVSRSSTHETMETVELADDSQTAGGTLEPFSISRNIRAHKYHVQGENEGSGMEISPKPDRSARLSV